MSSGTSGFFFCGMIEEPVQKRSGKSTNANWALVQIIISSAIRDRCIMVIAAADVNSIAKSRSLTESSEFSVGAAKPSASAVMCRLIG